MNKEDIEHARDAALEEAARLLDLEAQKFNYNKDHFMAQYCAQRAADIRALKGPNPWDRP